MKFLTNKNVGLIMEGLFLANKTSKDLNIPDHLREQAKNTIPFYIDRLAEKLAKEGIIYE